MTATMDQFFEKGFLQFVFLVLVTEAVCYLLDRFFKKRIDQYNERFTVKGINNKYLSQTVRTMIWFFGCLAIVSQIKPLRALGNTALGATSIIAIAVSIMIWMQMFIFGSWTASARVLPSAVWIIWKKAKPTMTRRAPRKMNTEAFASLLITLSRVVAEFPYIYLYISGSFLRARKSGSLSRSLPLL